MPVRYNLSDPRDATIGTVGEMHLGSIILAILSVVALVVCSFILLYLRDQRRIERARRAQLARGDEMR